MNIYKLLAVALLTLSAGVWAEQSTAASVKPGEQIPNSSGQTPAESQAEARTLAEAGAKAAKSVAQKDAISVEQAADFETWKEISLHLQAHGVQLVMDERDAASLFNKEPTDKSSFPVKFKDGDTVLNGRVSVKGSFTRNFLKKSLIIQFDNGTTWHGQDRISLDAMSTDVTELHQWLAHNLMTRLNMPTPEMLFTKLSINDRLVGRYLMVEWIKPAMFERFGLGHDGELYHPDDTFYCGNFQQEDIKRLQECFIRLDHGKDYSRLQQLAQDLISVPAEKFDEYLDKNFDGDSVINWLVVNTLAGSEDTYNKNFFLYYSNVTHKWTVVPWDYDMAFGRVADVGVLFPRTIFNTHFQYLHSPESGASSPLKEKTLQNNALYKRFKAKVKDLFADVPLRENSIQGWYNPHNFSQILKEKRAETYRSIMSEMYPNPDKSEFDYMYDSLRFFNEWRYQYLNKLMLSASVWNTPIWLPYKSYDPVEPRPDNYWLKRRIEQLNMLSPGDLMQAGVRVFFSDTMLGTPLMAIDVLSLSRPSRFDVQVSSQQVPPAVPDEIDPAACIERTWHINNRTQNSQVMGNLEIDFLNEGSTRHELGDKIKNTLGLTVWSNIDGEWLPMSSEVNPRSNSFTVKNVVLDTGSYTLVACVSRTQEAIAMARKKVAQERAVNRDNSSVKASRIEKQLRAHDEQPDTPPVHESSPTLEQKPFTIPPSADVKTSALDPRAAKQAAHAEAVRLKSEQKAKAEAQAQEKKAALAQAKQQATQEQAAKIQAQKEAKAAKLAATAAAKAEARAAADEKARAEVDAKVAKLNAQQDAKAAEQAAHAEAVRLKAEQKAKTEAQVQEKKAALAQAKQQAAQEQAARVQAKKEEKAAKLAAAAAAKAEARAAADEKARAEADAKVAKLKAQQDAKAAEQAAHAEAVRLKAEQKAKTEAEAQEKKAALAQAKQQAAQEQAAKVQAQKEEKAAKLAAAKAEARAAADEKARAEADAKVAKLKAQQDARAAEQAAHAEAVRLKAEQKAKTEAQAQEKKAALAQAKQQAAQEQAAKLQAQKEAKAASLAAAAAAKAEARAAADEKARAEADAKVAKLKAQQDARAAEQAAHAEAVRLKAEQKAKTEAQAQEKKAALAQAKQQAAQEQAARVQAQKEEKAEALRVKAEQKARAAADAAPAMQTATKDAAIAKADARVARLKARMEESDAKLRALRDAKAAQSQATPSSNQ